MTDLESRAVGELPALRTAPSSVLRAVRMVVFDFDGVFTDDAVYVSEDGRESVRCWRGDGLGLRKLDALGIETMILSTEVNPVVGLRARKLKIKCQQGIDDKRTVLTRMASEAGVPLAEIAYVGNDINDALCFSAVGVAIAVQMLTRTFSRALVTAPRPRAVMAPFAKSATVSIAPTARARSAAVERADAGPAEKILRVARATFL